jgi:hypothetical protein
MGRKRREVLCLFIILLDSFLLHFDSFLDFLWLEYNQIKSLLQSGTVVRQSTQHNPDIEFDQSQVIIPQARLAPLALSLFSFIPSLPCQQH